MKRVLKDPIRRRQKSWLPMIIVLSGFVWLFATAWLFAKPHAVYAQIGSDVEVERSVRMPVRPPIGLAGETYFSGDRTVGENEVIDGDLVVWSGDVTLEDGGEVKGSVVAYSGEVYIREYSVVHGDVTAWSGDVSIDGAVRGSVASWSGNVELSDSAVVDGDVSAMSGEIDRSENAVVKGSIVSGPNFKWPGIENPFERWGMAAPPAPIPPEAPEAPIRVIINDNQPGPIGRFFGFVFSVIAALFVSAVAGVVAALVYNFRPDLVRQIRANVTEQPVYAAVAGAVVNLPLAAIAGLLFITFCLIPLALPPLLLLVGLNAVGLTGMAQIVGERITKQLNLQLEPTFVIGVGAFAIVGVISILWAFGSCFGGIAWLAAIVVGSMGTGALLMPWLKQFGNRNATASTNSAASYAPSGTPVKVDIGNDGMKHETTQPTAPAASSTSTSTSTPPVTPLVPPVVVNVDPVTIDIGNPSSAPEANTGEVRINLGESGVNPESSTVVTPLASESATGVTNATESTAASITDDSDFTIIKGIGIVLDRRLKAAGVRTFAQLATLTPEEVAAIFDRPLTWVVEDDIIGQAAYFARKQ